MTSLDLFARREEDILSVFLARIGVRNILFLKEISEPVLSFENEQEKSISYYKMFSHFVFCFILQLEFYMVINGLKLFSLDMKEVRVTDEEVVEHAWKFDLTEDERNIYKQTAKEIKDKLKKQTNNFEIYKASSKSLSEVIMKKYGDPQMCESTF